MRRALAAVTVAAAAALASVATAQDAPTDPPRPPASIDADRVLGILAWRSAVWNSDPAMYARAARKFQAIVDAGGGKSDALTLFFLGHSLARSGSAAKAEVPLSRSQGLSPKFPGHLLAMAVRISSEQGAFVKQARTEEAIRILDEYLTEVARYDRKAPFAAELRYLGHLERGLRHYAIEQEDAALRDLAEAVSIARTEGHRPSLELVRVMIQAHKNVQQFAAAAQLVEESIRRDPGEASHYYLLGLIDAENRKLDDARVMQHQALDRRPDFPESHVRLAYAAWLDHDLVAMRRHLESYEAYWKIRWQGGAGDPDPGTQASILSGYGSYWQLRGDRLAEAGDLDGAKRMWGRARESYVAAAAKSRDCLRAVTNLIQVLTLLEAPAAEIEEWARKAQLIREQQRKGISAYHGMFC